MRLLNADTVQVESFNDRNTTPRYAILSHTWGEEEVTFQDLECIAEDPASQRSHKILCSAGYKKIWECCAKALSDDLDYVWVDTCCIDKTSSAELSEAINSMFQWYQDARVCYAYLEDIHALSSEGNDEEMERGEYLDEICLANARWFTRGWTLQELLAPRRVEFFVYGWKYLGTREGLSEVLMSITGIDSNILGQAFDPRRELSSISQRMNWASKRRTTRTEDTAYCLMGIFDVNMPLLYGEGSKAFMRLQEEIMKNSSDQSLFAWAPEGDLVLDLQDLQTNPSDPGYGSFRTDFHFDPVKHREPRSICHISAETASRRVSDYPTLGIFAEHPKEFQYQDGFKEDQGQDEKRVGKPYAITNLGVKIHLPVIVLAPHCGLFVVVLNCTISQGRGERLGILVQENLFTSQLCRLRNRALVRVTTKDLSRATPAKKVYLSRKSFQMHNFAFERFYGGSVPITSNVGYCPAYLD